MLWAVSCTGVHRYTHTCAAVVAQAHILFSLLHEQGLPIQGRLHTRGTGVTLSSASRCVLTSVTLTGESLTRTQVSPPQAYVHFHTRLSVSHAAFWESVIHKHTGTYPMSTPDAAHSLSYAGPAFQVNAHVKTSSTLWANLMLSHTHMQVEGVRQLTLKRVTRICTWVSHTHSHTCACTHTGRCMLHTCSESGVHTWTETHTHVHTHQNTGLAKRKVRTCTHRQM